MTALTTKTDLELAVAYELNGINLFGFDTYKHENRARADNLRAERDQIAAELVARGLLTATGELRADLHARAKADDAVERLEARNASYQRNRYR